MREKLVIENVTKLSESGVVMGMVTNGMLINERNAKELYEAGIGQVQVSVDGLSESHDRLRGVKGSREKAIRAVEYLKKAGVSVITSFAPTKFNVDEFPEYVDAVRELGVEEVRIQPLMPLGESQLHAEIFPDDEQYLKLSKFIRMYNFSNNVRERSRADHINEIDQTETLGFNILWGDPVDHIIRFSKYVTKPTYTYQIASTGKIALTPYFPITFGDLKKHSLQEYWEAGMNNIWEMRIVQILARQVRAVAHMSRLKHRTYFCDNIEIDLVENTKEEIEALTDRYFGEGVVA